jgi:hypothetical protein
MYDKRVGSRTQVMNGTAEHTSGGLNKSGLIYNKHGRIVSKLKSDMSKTNPVLKRWARSLTKCRKEQKLKEFVPVGGKSTRGKKLYKCMIDYYYVKKSPKKSPKKSAKKSAKKSPKKSVKKSVTKKSPKKK